MMVLLNSIANLSLILLSVRGKAEMERKQNNDTKEEEKTVRVAKNCKEKAADKPAEEATTEAVPAVEAAPRKSVL